MPIDESWNAIGCCDGAAKANVNDVGFIEALVAKIDPGHARPIYVVGYSNGGRLAYRMACTDPTLFDGLAAVKADPMPGCVVTKPENVIVFSSLNDKYVPYKPGEKGYETPPATVQIARLESDLKCSDKKVVTLGQMTVTTWSCADGKSSSGRSTRPGDTASRSRPATPPAATSSSGPSSPGRRWPRCPAEHAAGPGALDSGRRDGRGNR